MLHKFIEAKEKLLENAALIGKLPYKHTFPRYRRILLNKLASVLNLTGEVLFYVGGGCDAATGFALNKEARKVINVSIGKLYNIPWTSKELLSYCLSRPGFIFNLGVGYATDVSYDILPSPANKDKLNNPSAWALLTEMARMYALDGAILTDIFPASLCNNELVPDMDGHCFHLTFSNKKITRTVEVLSCDYSVIAPETEAINTYVHGQTGLHSVLVKAPLKIFDWAESLGHYNLVQAVKNLNGTVVYDSAGMANKVVISPLCLNPRQILFDKRKHSRFGYSPTVSYADFSELISVQEAYRDSPLYPQIQQLPE